MPRRREDKENAKLTDEERHILGGIRQQASRIRPQSIKSLVNRLISERGYAAVQGGEAIREAWEKVVGPQLARQAIPGVMRKGVLLINVADSLTLQELHFRKKQLLQQLQLVDSGLRVTDLKFKLSAH